MKSLTMFLLLGALAGCGRAEPSPLGRLAFIRNDSLYVQPLPDGRARLLAAGRGLAQPRWSPSGQWLALHASDGLRLLRFDGGGSQQLTKVAADFAWAPTDDRIGYIAEGNLIVARAGGIGVVLTEKTRTAAAEGLAWSADGQGLAYALRPAAPGGAPAAGSAVWLRLWSIPARGGAAVALSLPALPDAGVPLVRGWTGAGEVLVLLPAGDLRLGPAESRGAPLYAVAGSGAAGQPRRLADAVLPYPDFVAPRPGSGGAAFVEGAGPGVWRDKAVAVVGPGGADPRRASAPGRAATSPGWSRDGHRLAWVEMPEADVSGGVATAPGLDARRIVVADVDPAGALSPVRPLGGPAGRQEHPLWTGDGRHLLFVGWDAAGAAGVWLLAEGETGKRIVDSLSPPPGDRSWAGIDGHVAWDDLLDYWPGPPARR